MRVAVASPPRAEVTLGLRANAAQFTLLVIVNAFVGAMVGLERTILPALAESEFHLVARSAILSFIVVFGLTKAVTNYVAGRSVGSSRPETDPGRRLAGGGPGTVPADVGADLDVGARGQCAARCQSGAHLVHDRDHENRSRRRRAARAGDGAQRVRRIRGDGRLRLGTGWIAARSGLRPEPFYLGVIFVAAGLMLSLLFVRETEGHVAREVDRECDPQSSRSRRVRSSGVRAWPIEICPASARSAS